MIWIAPSEKEAGTRTLEKRLLDFHVNGNHGPLDDERELS